MTESYAIESDATFSDSECDPFDDDLDENSNTNTFHLVEISKETGCVTNVLIWSDNQNNFKNACYDYLIKLLPENDHASISAELKQMINVTMLYSGSGILLDPIDELNYSANKSHEIRLRNKKITNDTIIV